LRPLGQQQPPPRPGPRSRRPRSLEQNVQYAADLAAEQAKTDAERAKAYMVIAELVGLAGFATIAEGAPGH
jgi:hypothetical protein